jgi:hypothetical protein
MHVDPVVKQNNQRVPMSETRQRQTGHERFTCLVPGHPTPQVLHQKTEQQQHNTSNRNKHPTSSPPRHNNIQHTTRQQQQPASSGQSYSNTQNRFNAFGRNTYLCASGRCKNKIINKNKHNINSQQNYKLKYT